MDQGQGSQLTAIPRLSRLPLLRNANANAPVHTDALNKGSHLPRPGANTSRKISVKPLGESLNPSAQTRSFRHGSPTRGRDLSPVASAIPDSSLDTTPPYDTSDSHAVTNGDENDSIINFTKEKRRPRPSLSERTVETLAQMSPSPSPTRARSTTITSNGSMGPPARPTSAMKSSRSATPSTPSTGRASSPIKRPFRPPGRTESPTKDVPAGQQMPLDDVYTPPRAFLKDRATRIAQPPRGYTRSTSIAVQTNSTNKPALRPSSQAVKVKSMYDLRAASNRLATKPSLQNLQNTPSTPVSSGGIKYRDASPSASLLKARRPGENFLASTRITTTSSVPSRQLVIPKRPAAAKNPAAKEPAEKVKTPPKASTSLRDTIAKARAAKQATMRASLNGAGSKDVEWPVENESLDGIAGIGANSLKKKLSNAVTSGALNLSAMSLQNIPAEVMTMYDFSEDSHINWSEAVDLTKLLLADNELESLSESHFPDWTEEEMQYDAEKTNQFGGLEVLDLHNNRLQAVPIGLRRLARLHTLNLNGNALTMDVLDIVIQLPALRELRLTNCKLSGSLPEAICAMKNLQILDLRGNSLCNLGDGVASLSNLQRLLVGQNDLRSVNIDVLSQLPLIELDLSKNRLSGCLFDHTVPFDSLQLLDVSFNELVSFADEPFYLPRLQTLAINNNRLEHFPDVSRCDSLTALTAGENRLKDIPTSFYGLQNLRHADFSANSIKAVDNALVHMENLISLNLASNPLRERKYLTMSVEDIRTELARRLAPASTDEDNSAASNTVSSVSVQSHQQAEQNKLIKPKQGVLDLSSRGLTEINCSILDLSAPVHTIRLSNNDLKQFPTHLLAHESVRSSLKSLDLSHNPYLHPVEYLDIELSLPVLQSLYIVSTGLTTLDTLTNFLSAPQLKELNISCHRLAGSVPSIRESFPAATTLLASDNWFESINVEAIRGLEYVDVRNNEIESLPPALGLLGNHANSAESGRLKTFECSGNRFRVPRLIVVERGTEAILRDLRRMVPIEEIPEEWQNEI